MSGPPLSADPSTRTVAPAAEDAYAPLRIAQRVEQAGVGKAELPVLQTVMLGLLAGAFIAFGAMLYTVVVSDSELGFGPTRLLGGMAFSVGLILVVVGGAELFTGNNLIVMAWADRRIGARALLRNWVLVYLANLVGSLACVAMMYWSGLLAPEAGPAAATAAAIARAKVALPFTEAFTRGVLCNVLVCLAVWMSYGAHQVSGKILAMVLPVAAFVAIGFEHSVANMYLVPAGMLAAGSGLDVLALLHNLVPVTLGNVVGGGLLVALVYWVIYLRGSGPAAD